MRVSKVYDSYWRFAAERQAIYLSRLAGNDGPWTHDPILQRHRFTNCYRAADRVSQYLIGEVQYGAHRSSAPDEIFFRTMLFKLFNRIPTWQLLEQTLGLLSWQSADPHAITAVLDRAITRGDRVYSAAYIMPSPKFGHVRKHRNHIALLWQMMEERLPSRIAATQSLEEAYVLLRRQPGLGPFLAFQFAIDLNYSALLDHGKPIMSSPALGHSTALPNALRTSPANPLRKSFIGFATARSKSLPIEGSTFLVYSDVGSNRSTVRICFARSPNMRA